MAALSPLQRDVLRFEESWAGTPEEKEAAVMRRFGLNEVRYQQILHSLLAEPAALKTAPVLVHRLVRLEEARQRSVGGGRD